MNTLRDAIQTATSVKTVIWGDPWHANRDLDKLAPGEIALLLTPVREQLRATPRIQGTQTCVAYLFYHTHIDEELEVRKQVMDGLRQEAYYILYKMAGVQNVRMEIRGMGPNEAARFNQLDANLDSLMLIFTAEAEVPVTYCVPVTQPFPIKP